MLDKISTELYGAYLELSNNDNVIISYIDFYEIEFYSKKKKSNYRI